MIKFSRLSQIEHGDYPFEDAVTKEDTFNGAFGDVAAGEFTVGANKKKAIMQLEVGDDEYMPTYKIAKGSHVRVLDFEKVNGQLMEVYGDEVPAEAVKGSKLESDADGSLKVNESATAPYYEVTRIIGNKLGVEVKVITSAE